MKKIAAENNYRIRRTAAAVTDPLNATMPKAPPQSANVLGPEAQEWKDYALKLAQILEAAKDFHQAQFNDSRTTEQIRAGNQRQHRRSRSTRRRRQ